MRNVSQFEGRMVVLESDWSAYVASQWDQVQASMSEAQAERAVSQSVFVRFAQSVASAALVSVMEVAA